MIARFLQRLTRCNSASVAKPDRENRETARDALKWIDPAEAEKKDVTVRRIALLTAVV